jgi:hypothetical protein
MHPAPTTALIFDMDGTMTDSMPYNSPPGLKFDNRFRVAGQCGKLPCTFSLPIIRLSLIQR